MSKPSPEFEAYIARLKAWKAAGCPMTEDERRRSEQFLERCNVESGGPIPARFKNLQHLDEKS